MAIAVIGGTEGVLLKSSGTGAPDILNTTNGIDMAAIQGRVTNTGTSTQEVKLFLVGDGDETEADVDEIWHGTLLPGTSSPNLKWNVPGDMDLRGECTTDDEVTAYFTAIEVS